MKAAIRTRYGSPEVLKIKEIEIPEPKDNEVLIRVYATTVNRTDCGVLWGKPFILRLFTGILNPRSSTTGSDYAGQVEAVGRTVQSFKVGDKVMGFDGVGGCGSHAQFIVVEERKALVKIPVNVSYEDAAACIEGAFYAFNGVSSVHPKAGQTALVHGATGAIGSSMVQILKFYGVVVTATCRPGNMELVKSLGADKVIDYTTDDFTKDKDKYDFVLMQWGKAVLRNANIF